MPLPVYQNMVNLIVGFPIWRGPSIFLDVAMWKFLDVTKSTALTPLSVLFSCKFLISYCQFKNVFLAYFGIEMS
jgi:hypothetical protein